MAHTFVLVHGAWHGGWCWRRVADRLRRDGHVVFTPTLTGLGERAHLVAPRIDLATHVADVVNLLKWERLSDVVLCGHSYGGFVISGVAEVMPAQTRSIVFLDAFSSRERRHDPKTHRGGGSRRHSRGYAARRSRRAPAPAEAFGVNAADRDWVDSLCVPQPIGTFTSPIALSGARERIARKTYIRAKGYHNPSFDRAFATVQSDPSWHCHQLPCGHDVMIDLPDRLTELLLQAAA